MLFVTYDTRQSSGVAVLYSTWFTQSSEWLSGYGRGVTYAHASAVAPRQAGDGLQHGVAVAVVVVGAASQPALRPVLVWSLEQRRVVTHPVQIRLHVRLSV